MPSQLIFVGSYAEADQPGIHVFGFDAGVGALQPRTTYGGIANPSFLILHPKICCLYSVSEVTGDGSVYAFRFDCQSGALEPINRQPSGGSAPCHLVLDESGRWLIVSNYLSGTVQVLPLADDGALGEPTHLVQHHGQGVHPERQERPHAHSAAFAPDGRFILVADLGIDQIVVYAFDAVEGKLGAHASAPGQPGAGPRHLAFHPGRQHLYVVNELDNTIGVYGYDALNGGLHERQLLTTLPHRVQNNRAADIHVERSGTRVYVSNRGHNSIAVFDIAANGTLALAAIQPCGGRGPRNFALAPDGRSMLIANRESGDVVVLPILDDAARLGKAMARAVVPGASCVQFGPSP
jgi:6-phosphogluconolactonase